MELRGDILNAPTVRDTYQAGERPPRQISAMAQFNVERREEWGVIGFKKKVTTPSESRRPLPPPIPPYTSRPSDRPLQAKTVSESAGTVRLTVSRKSGGDAQALVFFSTEDGTALAGYDYEPQSGHLFFLRGQQTKEIKILIIDDDEVECNKTFHVLLGQPENCVLHKTKKKIVVTILDDDQDFWQNLRRTTFYTIMEVFLIVYALFGNEIVMLQIISFSRDPVLQCHPNATTLGCYDEAGQPRCADDGGCSCWSAERPIDRGVVYTTVGVANLVLFLFFFMDMCLNTMILGTKKYVLSVRRSQGRSTPNPTPSPDPSPRLWPTAVACADDPLPLTRNTHVMA